MGGHSWGTLAIVAVSIIVAVAFSTPSSREAEDPDPLPPLVYDVDVVGAYWAQRPVAVARRSTVVAAEGLQWAFGGRPHFDGNFDGMH